MWQLQLRMVRVEWTCEMSSWVEVGTRVQVVLIVVTTLRAATTRRRGGAGYALFLLT